MKGEEPTGWKSLSDEHLQALPTKRLMAVYKLARSAAYHASYNYETCGAMSKEECDRLHNRAAFMKSILDTREHLE